MAGVKRPYPVSFRHHAALAVAALITACASVTLLAGGWGFVVFPIVALLLGVWVIRTGTDANAEEIRISALLGRRRITWNAINELTVDGRGRVNAVLHSGASVRLPAVRASDLPRLIGASGQDLLREPGSAEELSTPRPPG
jgi:hypothetical protein